MSAVLSVSEIIAALEAHNEPRPNHRSVFDLSSEELARFFELDEEPETSAADELVGRVTELRSLPGRVPRRGKVRRRTRQRRMRRNRRIPEAAGSGA